jgi:hypothetical protein
MGLYRLIFLRFISGVDLTAVVTADGTGLDSLKKTSEAILQLDALMFEPSAFRIPNSAFQYLQPNALLFKP